MDDIRENNTPDTSGQTTGSYGQPGQYDQYGQSPAPQPETFPPITPTKKKRSKAAIIVVLVVLVIFGIAAAVIAPSYMQARKFGKAIAGASDLDGAVEMIFPEKLLDEAPEVRESFTSSMLSTYDEVVENDKARFIGAKCGKSLNKNTCRTIEDCYNLFYKMFSIDEKVKIEKGYEYKIRFKAGGKKYYSEAMVVKTKDDGWKVFPGTKEEAEEVIEMLGSYADLMSEYSDYLE